MTMRWSDFESGQDRDAVTVNVTSMPELEAELRACFAAKKGFCLATLNLDHVYKLRHLPAFAEAYRQHSHVTADGNPIVWISRLAGDNVSLLPGSDLVRPVSRIATECNAALAFLGSSQAALAGAKDALCAEIIRLPLVTHESRRSKSTKKHHRSAVLTVI